MSAPGEYLKKQRELRGITLTDVSNAIKVPLKLLKALEADNYEPLPHPTFVKGFIKAYCRHLGIDENDAVLRYEMFLQEAADFDEAAVAREAEEARKGAFFSKPANVTMSLVAIGIVAIVVFFFVFRTDVQKTDVAGSDNAAPDTAAAPVVADASVETPKVVEVKADGSGAADVKIMDGPEAVRERVLPPNVAPDKGAAQAPAISTQPARPVEAQPAVTPKAPRRDAANDAGHTLVAAASELTWVQVRIDDKAPFEILMRKGQRETWRADKVFFYISETHPA